MSLSLKGFLLSYCPLLASQCNLCSLIYLFLSSYISLILRTSTRSLAPLSKNRHIMGHRKDVLVGNISTWATSSWTLGLRHNWHMAPRYFADHDPVFHFSFYLAESKLKTHTKKVNKLLWCCYFSITPLILYIFLKNTLISNLIQLNFATHFRKHKTPAQMKIRNVQKFGPERVLYS